jgi:hypothetical protein
MTYKDHFEKLRKIQFTAALESLERDIERYGAPSELFGSFGKLTEAAYQKLLNDRENALRNGLLKVRNNVLQPDYSAIVRSYFESYGKPLALAIEAHLTAEGKNDKFHFIQSAMKFVQDIPYGVQNFKLNPNKTLAGIIPPPAILWAKFGECDSKTLLFCSVLLHRLADEEIAFLLNDGHMLSAVRVEEDEAEEISYWTEDMRKELRVTPEPRFSPMKLGADWFLPCETAGPARLYWGELMTNEQYHYQML